MIRHGISSRFSEPLNWGRIGGTELDTWLGALDLPRSAPAPSFFWGCGDTPLKQEQRGKKKNKTFTFRKLMETEWINVGTRDPVIQ